MKLRMIWATMSLAIASACGPSAPETPVASEESVAVTASSVDAAENLFGQWRVTSVAGKPPELNDMILLFGDDWWHMQSQCIYAEGDYKGDAGTLNFAAIGREFPDLPDGLRIAEAMCARTLSDAEKDVRKALYGSAVYKLERNRLTITTPEGELVAVPQEGPSMAIAGTSSDYPGFVWGQWQVADIDGQPIADASIIRSHRRMTARIGCSYYQWLSLIDDGGVRQRPIRREPFETGCARDLTPAETRMLEILETADRFSGANANERRMISDKGAVRLVN